MVSREGAGTNDCSGAAGGVITVGDDGTGSVEGEGTASGVNDGVGAVPGDTGVQPAASNNSKAKITPVYLIYMPSVHNMSIWIISYNLR